MGKYWSSRNTAAIGAPSVPPCTRSRSSRKTGALRSTNPLWLATPEASDRLDECGGASEVDVERLLAEHGSARGQGLVHRAPVRRRRRADPDGIAAPGHFGRVRHDVATQDIGEAAGTLFTLVVDGHDLGVDDTAVNEGLEAQAMGPRNETRPDKTDAQHAWTLGGGPCAVSFSARMHARREGRLPRHRLGDDTAGQRVHEA